MLFLNFLLFLRSVSIPLLFWHCFRFKLGDKSEVLKNVTQRTNHIVYMKKLMLFFCATLLSSGITFAQHKSVKKTKRETTAKALVAPAPVKDAFGQNFADVSDAKWSKSVTGNWTANFQRDSVKTAVEYTADGNWVATRSEYTGDRLPETIASTLKTKYPAATVKDGWRIERANVAAYYKVNIQDNGTEKSVLINEAGTITE